MTYKWIQDRIRDLHAGNLSEADRLRLLEIAKTDPFVADALEGYEAHAAHDHSALLRILSQRIENKSTSRRTKLIPLSRGWVIQAVAASFVLILATWAVIYYVGQDEKTVLVTLDPESSGQDQNAYDISSHSDSVTGNMAASPATEEMKADQSGLRANAQAKANDYLARNKTPGKSTATDAKVTDAEVKEKNDYTFTDPVATIPPPSGTIMSQTEIAATSGEAGSGKPADNDDTRMESKSLSDEGLYANQMNPALMATRVTGKVMDKTGLPLIGANLSIQNTNLGTFSDKDGRFELFLPEKESNVDVTYSGFIDATLKLKQGDEDVVIVLPDNQRSHQVLTYEAKTTSKKENIPAGRAYSPTRPKEAEPAYGDYLRSNSRLPLQENVAVPGKEVIVEFNVNSKGRPEQIRIVRSSNNKDFDEEALRLIKKGPDWNCEFDMYPCTTQYTIYFQ